mgnify:CR=1 FL=1
MNTPGFWFIVVFVITCIYPISLVFTFPFIIGLFIWDIVEWHQRRKASKEFDVWYADYQQKQMKD